MRRKTGIQDALQHLSDALSLTGVVGRESMLTFASTVCRNVNKADPTIRIGPLESWDGCQASIINCIHQPGVVELDVWKFRNGAMHSALLSEHGGLQTIGVNHALKETHAKTISLRQLGQHSSGKLSMISYENSLLAVPAQGDNGGWLTGLCALVDDDTLVTAGLTFAVQCIHTTSNACCNHNLRCTHRLPQFVTQQSLHLLAHAYAHTADAKGCQASVQVVRCDIRVRHSQDSLTISRIPLHPGSNDGTSDMRLAGPWWALNEAETLLHSILHSIPLRLC
mmetsp:Transcript_20417/g.47608  ORF Transcript_20417/g.47608 Transcript_20417/m.47608 type:complete len:281 (+) Transcript_20417:687-1529(+)